ncbi:integrase, catalytic region, zinc finger, CCHC-type containing protein [Tanacetum coccineum]
MSRQYTKPKRKGDDSWFKEKVLLVQVQAHGQILNEEELAFLADPDIPEGQSTPTRYDSYDNMNNNVVNQAVQMMSSSQQSNVMNHSETEITNDSNIIPYSQYMIESQQATVQKKNSVSNQSVPSFDQLFELNELKAQSQEKDMVIKKLKERIKSLSGKMDKDKIKQDLEEIETINIKLDHREKALAITTLKDELRTLKGKALVDNNVSNHPSDPELHQVNMEPITPKLLNKRTTHSAYIKYSQEEVVVLRDLVDHIKANYPLDPLLEYAYKYTKLIQEMLSKISKTCPSINSSGEQLVASTSASGSQPSGNTKKDKIQQTPSSTLKNKVEAHPRKVKSSLKNKDCVVAPKGTAHVQHSKLNANYELKCVKCNGYMLSDNHDFCVLDFINNVNGRAKSRSVISLAIAATKKAFRIYNRRTRRIVETIHVDFDKLTAMASEHSSSGPILHEMNPATISSGLVPNPYPSTPFIILNGNMWEEVYVSQPDGFVDKDNPNQVYKLKKALYRLKQALRACQISLDSLKKTDFNSCDPIGYSKWWEKSKLDEDKEGKAARPTEKHLNAVKRIFRYLKGTIHRGLWYSKDSLIALTAFADADHAGCQDTRRSTSEAEYIAFVRLSKHIDIRFHFIKEHVENGVIELYFINTEYQLADIFTKALGRNRIEFLINKLGMRSFTPETLKQLADEVDE